MNERHRDARDIHYVAYFLGVGCVRSRPPLVVGVLKSVSWFDMHHVLRGRIDRRCDRTGAIASQRPALIGKTIETVVTENEMVE